MQVCYDDLTVNTYLLVNVCVNIVQMFSLLEISSIHPQSFLFIYSIFEDILKFTKNILHHKGTFVDLMHPLGKQSVLERFDSALTMCELNSNMLYIQISLRI